MERDIFFTCFNCKNADSTSSGLLKCSQCKTVYYCGKTCQANDWDKGKHRAICKLLSELDGIDARRAELMNWLAQQVYDPLSQAVAMQGAMLAAAQKGKPCPVAKDALLDLLVGRDDQVADRLAALRESALAGDARTSFLYGVARFLGLGPKFPPDAREALAFFNTAAEAGHPHAREYARRAAAELPGPE
jgi:TPR repeat protein